MELEYLAKLLARQMHAIEGLERIVEQQRKELERWRNNAEKPPEEAK